jgi:pimeloyl-ACP methyl ester carboxylesterase
VATFVLVHGGWHGGWCWREVAPLLRQAGHTVPAPTLTGLGERAHLLASGVDLDLHARDIVNVLEYEGLADVVLVGHSHGDMVVSAVAGRAIGRLARLVYPYQRPSSASSSTRDWRLAWWRTGVLGLRASWQLPCLLSPRRRRSCRWWPSRPTGRRPAPR